MAIVSDQKKFISFGGEIIKILSQKRFGSLKTKERGLLFTFD